MIAGFTVTDFPLLIGCPTRSALTWALPGIIALAAVAGLVQGAVLRRTRPAVHHRIGLSAQAFQLERVTEVVGEI